MDIRKILAQNLRALRKHKGWSQEELAHRAGVDRTYISALERGIYSATIVMVEKLAAVLDVEPPALIDRGMRNRQPKR